MDWKTLAPRLAVVGLAIAAFAGSALVPQTATMAVQGLAGVGGMLLGWLLKFPGDDK